MITFEVFQEQFLNTFSNIENFIASFGENKTNPFIKGELKENLDNSVSDSYDYTDVDLKRVFYFADFDIYIMFDGKDQSYSGLSWNSMKEVKEVTKTISQYE